MIPIPVADMWKNIQQGLRDYDADTLKVIQQQTRVIHSRLCETVDFQPYRRAETVTGVMGGALLPANLVDILYVEDDMGVLYWPAEQWQAKQMGMPCFVRTPTATTPLLIDETGLNLDSGASSLGIDATAYVGEYCTLGSEPGVYKILDATGTLLPRYYGPRLNRERLVIRPIFTQKIQFYDYSGDEETGTYTVAYWVQPDVLYQGFQPVLMPNPRSLELRVIIEMLGFHEKNEKSADNYRKEFEREWALTMRLNPKTLAPATPMNVSGTRLSFSRNGR